MTYITDLDTAPVVALGDALWPVPALAVRQNKIIDPLILSLLPVFAMWQSDKSAALSQLGAAQYEALLEIAFVAIRRAHPELTREQFLDMPVTLPQLIVAFTVIAQQTGVFARSAAGESPAGEAAGEGSPLNPSFPTGTSSPPTSAT